jgi:hypothetical protein
MAFNCLGAWLRWLSVHVAAAGAAEHGRAIAIASSVCLGFAAAVVVRRRPPQHLATARAAV